MSSCAEVTLMQKSFCAKVLPRAKVTPTWFFKYFFKNVICGNWNCHATTNNTTESIYSKLECKLHQQLSSQLFFYIGPKLDSLKKRKNALFFITNCKNVYILLDVISSI